MTNQQLVLHLTKKSVLGTNGVLSLTGIGGTVVAFAAFALLRNVFRK
ncbi:hypothetical protein H1S01_18385 [Heliobacterium chlorum]|uniref:Uncharacterized protein n=1 Tax=Heliobacterium chlorum TaxID=2698 RepID=A0ABR7T8G5_HELCL|nr:hypothetical protein [Heliobacterium chlorum]MBC9786427.1 hypothetical protein [Heliobacterium chlorum]